MTTPQTASDKARSLLATPGAVTLLRGHGVARVYTVIGRTGTYRTTEATCDCPRGLNGLGCYHCEAIRLHHAGEPLAAPAPVADVWALLPAVDDDLEVPTPQADEALTVGQAAARLGGLKPDTIRRYLAAGKLARLDGGVSAASVAAYAEAREANITRTRFRKTTPAPSAATQAKPRAFFAPADMPAVEEIEAEAIAFDEAADSYRAGDRGKNRARKLLDKVPAGQYGRARIEWVPSNTNRADLDAIAAIFKAYDLGPVPMKRDRDSLKVTIAAAPAVQLRAA